MVGGYYGKGKRTNVYGAFLLACYDADSEEYQTICKIGTGFSEEALDAHYKELKPLEMDKPRPDIKVGGAKPDVWFEPKVVWEVLTADLSLSPIYMAAQGLVCLPCFDIEDLELTLCPQIEERGISLRFPRFIRVRDDKAPDDATGPEQVRSAQPVVVIVVDFSGLDRRDVRTTKSRTNECSEKEAWRRRWRRWFLVVIIWRKRLEVIPKVVIA